MQVGILGPLAIAGADGPVRVGGARLRALLIRLAVEPGRWVSASVLADALWPDDAPADETNALQSLVSRLRRALPEPDRIESGPAGYRLVLADGDLDADRFATGVARARTLIQQSATAEGAALLREVLELWRGPALADVLDLPFAAGWANRLEESRLAATEDRIAADLELSRLDDLVAELEDLVRAHPLRERLVALLMQTLQRSARQAEALTAYERLRHELADELGVDPSAELQALHLDLLTVQAPAPARRRRTNLRPALTSFVGREDDVRHVTQQLHRSRLVTLVGAGGAGKTRLSVEIGSRLDDLGTDGVWQVELAPVSDPDGLAAAALGAIGTRDVARVENRVLVQRGDLARLVDALDDRDAVVLLDNCEHVIDAAAELAEQLLAECPGLRILATSREPLGITGEALWPVPPLAVTDSGTDAAAVRLFLDRAELVSPGFTLDDTNRGTVVEICRRLDGMPLAIELAAARLRTLSVEAVRDRLADRFRLLTGGSRTAMPRHQTLRAVVTWSWDLLTETERRLAERLSAFPAGATPEAAAAVSVPATDDVLDLLTALTDKSLLVPGDGPRFRMLETIREFAGERLAERGEVTELRRAFTRYFVEFAERAEPQLRGRDQLTWLRLLDTERENLQAAIRFAAELQDADSAVRLGAGMSWYWTLLGRHEEAGAWLDVVLDVPGERPIVPYVIAEVTRELSKAATGHGMPQPETLEMLEGLLAQVPDPTVHPMFALIEPGLSLLRDDDTAMRAFVAKTVQDHPDPWARAMLRVMDAVSAENSGDLDRVRTTLPPALAAFRELGDRWGLGTVLGTLAGLQQLDGDTEGAITTLEESRTLMGELRATDDVAYVMSRIAILRVHVGQIDQARAELVKAHELARDDGSLHAEAFALLGLALVDRASGDRESARRKAEAAQDLAERATYGPPQLRAMALTSQALIELDDGRTARARTLLTESWPDVLNARDMPVTATTGVQIARLVAQEGDPAQAALLVGAAAAVRGSEDRGDPVLLTVENDLREALGEDGFARSREQGRALTQERALELFGSVLADQALRR